MKKNDFFAEWIMTVRLIKGWSQNYVAKQIGVSKQLVCGWESGINKPPKNPLVRSAIAKTFGVCVSDIFDDETGTYRVTHHDRIAIRRGYALWSIRLSHEDAVHELAYIYRITDEEVEYILETATDIEKKLIRRLLETWEKDERKVHNYYGQMDER